MITQVILNLLLVLSLAFACYFVAKKWRYRTVLGAAANIKILSMLSLGTKEKVVLLEVEGEKVLVGVTPQQMTTLFHVSETNKSQKLNNFSEILQKKYNEVSESA